MKLINKIGLMYLLSVIFLVVSDPKSFLEWILVWLFLTICGVLFFWGSKE